jgi:Flp pilus assembly protein TadD
VVLAPVTNAPLATNRAGAHTNVAAVKTNLPAATNVAHLAHAPTNKPAAATTTKPVEVAAVVTNTAPPPKTNILVAAATPLVTNAPPNVVEKAVEKPAEPEPQKPLEVVNVDEEPKLAVAKDIAPPKPAPTIPAASKTNAPPKTEVAAVVTNAPAQEPPLIRPARREEKEKTPGMATTILKKANPVNWFRKDKTAEDKTEKSDKTEKVVASKPEPPKESAVKELPEPPKEPTPEVQPEPVFARYPYQTTPLPRTGNHTQAEPLFNEAVIAHREGKLGKAMDGYRAALRQDPRYFEAQLNLGIAAAQASDLSLALASLEDAVRFNPKSAEARFQFAMALRRANYPLDANNELKTLIEESPNETRAYLALGNLYSQILNKPDLAIQNYQRVLELSPQHPQAPQIRAWLAQH